MADNSKADSIKVEVEKLMGLANKLAAIAQKINTIIGDEYNGSLEEIQKYWGGENAGALLSAALKIGEGVVQTEKELIAAAETLIEVAKAYGEAESKAGSEAKS